MAMGKEASMRTRITIPLVFVMVLTLVPLGSAGANGYWPISDDTTLTEDYHGQIEIVADGKTLDCDGFSIIGEGDGNGIVLDGRSGVTIRNCRIEGFFAGIFAFDSYEIVVKNNTFAGNELAVFTLMDSHHLTIKDNLVESGGIGGFFIGFGVDGLPPPPSFGNVIAGNVVFGTDEAFEFRFLRDSRITDNRVIGSQMAIGIGDESEGNMIAGNVVMGNAVGISVFTNATGNVITENVIKGNGEGIVVSEGSTENIFKENRIRDNAEFGFNAFGESAGNSVVENHFCHNGLELEDGGGDWGNSEDSPTTYTENKVCGNWIP
jgi:parallel beta-helix repeat protein